MKKKKNDLDRLADIGQQLENREMVSLEDANFVENISRQYMSDETYRSYFPEESFSNENFFQSKIFKVGLIAVIAAIIAKILGMFGGGAGGGGGGGGGGSGATTVAKATEVMSNASNSLAEVTNIIPKPPSLTSSDKAKLKEKLRENKDGDTTSNKEPKQASSPEADKYLDVIVRAQAAIRLDEHDIGLFLDLTKNPTEEKLIAVYHKSSRPSHQFLKYKLLNDPKVAGILGSSGSNELPVALQAMLDSAKTFADRANLLAAFEVDEGTGNTERHIAWTDYVTNKNLLPYFGDDYGPTQGEKFREGNAWPALRDCISAIVGVEWDSDRFGSFSFQRSDDTRQDMVNEILKKRKEEIKDLFKPVEPKDLNPAAVVAALKDGNLLEAIATYADLENPLEKSQSQLKHLNDAIAQFDLLIDESKKKAKVGRTYSHVAALIGEYKTILNTELSMMRAMLLIIGMAMSGMLNIASEFDDEFDPENGNFIKLSKQLASIGNEAYVRSPVKQPKVWLNW